MWSGRWSLIVRDTDLIGCNRVSIVRNTGLTVRIRGLSVGNIDPIVHNTELSVRNADLKFRTTGLI